MTTEAPLPRDKTAQAPTVKRATGVLVTGAGRSGTSAITRGLQTLGVQLGDRLRPGSGKNPTGFFEDLDLLDLSKRLRRELGLNSGSVRLSAPADWETSGVRALHQEAVDTIRRRFGREPLWGFKYARSLRMLPFWEGVFAELDTDLACVVALRNPLSVARSRTQINPQRGRPVWNNLEWLTSVAPYFDHLRRRRFVVVDFDAVLTDPAAQLQRVAKSLNLALDTTHHAAIDKYAREFLRPGMRHSRFSIADLEADPQVHRLVVRVYAWLHGLAHDDLATGDESTWAEWASIKSALAELAPLLAELEELRNQLNRALWNPATPVQALGQVWRNWRSR